MTSRSPSRRGVANLGPWLPAVVAAAAYVLLVFSWTIGNPPFASPDEAAHLIRAIGVGTGQVAGEPAQFPYTPGTNRAQLDFMNQFTRAYDLPAGLSPQPWQCGFWTDSRTTAACLADAEPVPEPTRELSYVGSYTPASYLLPGLAARFGSDAANANLLGRLAAGLLHSLLLVGAVLLAWDKRRPSVALLGVFVAVTPMVIFVASALNPSGLETAAGIAFAVALLRLFGRGAGTLTWIAVAVAGSMLALSRVTGPVWLVLDVILVVLLVGPRRAWATVASRGRVALGAGAALLASVALNRLWETLYSPAATASLSPFPDSVVGGFRQLPLFFEAQIGTFGYLEFHLPSFALNAWWALLFLLLAAAALVGRTRERLTLALGVAGAVALPVGFYALLYRHSGFGLQGRYLLPVLVMIPLAAGEVIRRNPHRVARTTLSGAARWVATLAAGIHLFGWYWNARRYAVGTDGPIWFLGQSEWAPAVGWGPAFAVVILGALCLAAAGWLASAASVPDETRVANAVGPGAPAPARRRHRLVADRVGR